MATKITVSPEAFAYLEHQRGKLWDLRQDFPAWLKAYKGQLDAAFKAMRDHLPAEAPDHILDIGGGMGGIDILLSRHYQAHPTICILDGADDEPGMVRHSETFSSARVASEFLIDNGVPEVRIQHIAPADPGEAVAKARAEGKPLTPYFDLVISFSSWCFHYPPATYLEWLSGKLRPGATLIVEVRRGKGWEHELARHGFRLVAEVFLGGKSDLFIFRAPDEA